MTVRNRYMQALRPVTSAKGFRVRGFVGSVMRDVTPGRPEAQVACAIVP
jgi:hypothetical protein